MATNTRFGKQEVLYLEPMRGHETLRRERRTSRQVTGLVGEDAETWECGGSAGKVFAWHSQSPGYQLPSYIH